MSIAKKKPAAITKSKKATAKQATVTKQKATKKVEPKKTSKAAGNKVFDVSAPGTAPASPTSRPIITTHHNLVRDPMVSSPDDKNAAVSEPEATATEIGAPLNTVIVSRRRPPSKMRIEPLNTDLAKESETPTIVLEATDSPVETEAATEEPDAAPAATEPDTFEQPPKDEENTAYLDALTSEENAEKPTDTPTEPAPAENTESPPEAEEKNEPTSETKSAESVPANEPAEPKPAEDGGAGQGDAKPEDDEVTEAANQAAKKKEAKSEEDEAAKLKEKAGELIAQKKYFVPVNAVQRRHNIHVLWVFLVVFVLVVGVFAAVDAGYLDIGIKLPFDLLPDLSE